MSNPISWTEETWNPIHGCTPISPGCANCYARRMARRLAGRYGYPEAPNYFDVTLRPDRLRQPLKWRKPRRVFVCSMSDLFHEDVPTKFIADIWSIMYHTWKHTFQILTKRPRRMAQFVKGWNANAQRLPSNIYLGVTAEDQERADERIPVLLQIPAAFRFASLEPSLGGIDLVQSGAIPPSNVGEMFTGNLCNDSLCRRTSRHYPGEFGCRWNPIANEGAPPALNQVIVGGETGPGARPMHPDWARSLRDQCASAGVGFHFKSWGDLVTVDHAIEHLEYIPHLDTRPHTYIDGCSMPFVRVGAKRAEHLLDGMEHRDLS